MNGDARKSIDVVFVDAGRVGDEIDQFAGLHLGDLDRFVVAEVSVRGQGAEALMGLGVSGQVFCVCLRCYECVLVFFADLSGGLVGER